MHPIYKSIYFQGAIESIAMKTPKERTEMFEKISGYVFLANFLLDCQWV